MFSTMNMLDCLGVCQVANNKETDTNEIQVNLPGDFPSQDGENKATAETVTTTHNTTTGDTKQGKVLVGNTVPATWMPLNTNRITAPDVREGSKVVLYQFKNTNKYLWTLYGLNGSMRLETIVFAISASPNIDENTPITPDNYYIFTVSSHQKKIELITGQGNGEATTYQITLDMGKGYYGSLDGFGQIFMNNAVERSLTYLNKDKTQLSIDKRNFSLINLGETLIDTKESILMRSKDITLLAQNKFYLKAGHGEIVFDNELVHKVGTAYGLTVGGKYTQNVSGGVDITTPLVTMNQKLNVVSGITSPSMKVAGGELAGHVHGGVEGGKSSTAPFPFGGRSINSIALSTHNELDSDNEPLSM